ncbi:MAG: S8 family serine peptidase [Candidatus Woesearchaeota archaeon]
MGIFKNNKIPIIAIVLILALAVIYSANAEPDRKIYRTIEEKIESEGAANVIIQVFESSEAKQSKRSASTIQNTRVLQDMKYHEFSQSTNAHSKTYSGELTINGLEDINSLREQGYNIKISENRVFILDATRDIDDEKNLETGLLIPEENSEESNDEIVLQEQEAENENFVERELGIATDNSIPSIGANYSWNVLNITGRNVTIAVIDSGIAYTHPDLGGCLGAECKVIGGYDFVNDDSDPLDDNGHGTHVAGIIGANGTVMGVAPDVKFYALKACNAAGSCNESHILEAIDWAIANDVDIISMSIGRSDSSAVEGNTGKDTLSQKADEAIDAGIIVVIAAGNHGNGTSTIAVPGASSNAITVGNINDQGTETQSDDRISTDSSRGPTAFGRLDPDISAPGSSIYSTNITGYMTLSGTSMATPHITGAIALMLEQDNTLTNSEARAKLMSSAYNVTGRLFDVGAGEVNMINVLTNNMSAIVEAENSYGSYMTSDRWEFVSPTAGTEYANITITNDNDYDINFTLAISNFENLENSITLNNSQFGIPNSIVVSASSSQTFSINFTHSNFSAEYATTYGGKILFLANNSMTLTVPIVVTVPIKNYANIARTMKKSGINIGDVFYYAYYNEKAGNERVNISWSSSSSDLDLYVYNSTGDIDDYAGFSNTNNESVLSTSTNTIKWIRIHGYSFTSTPYSFSINITDTGNVAPNITNVTDGVGSSDMNFTVSENVTLRFYFIDSNNDTLTYSLNDSRYALNLTEEDSGVLIYTLNTNTSNIGTHSVRLTIQDEYGASTYRDVSVTIYDVRILSYSPEDLTPAVSKNTVVNFSQISENSQGSPLNYYWYVDGVLNSTEENISLDTTFMDNDNYNITFITGNDNTNASISWNLSIDQSGPSITIIRPTGTLNNSVITINISVSDESGIDSCWYNINVSTQNHTISNCINTTAYIASGNGNYTLTIYSNDTLGFLSSASRTFLINDITPPQILSVSPSGTIDFTEEVNLTATLNENATCKYDQDDSSYDSMGNTFEITGLVNIKEANVDTSERYEWFVRCMDLSGNKNNASSIINFTVEEEDDSGGNSGSSGGTGTSGTAPAAPPSTASKYSMFIIEAYDNITINLNSENIALKNLFIDITGTKNNVEIIILQHNLDAAPAAINLFQADRTKYAFIELKHSTLPDSEIHSAKIRFSVKKSWIEENGIDMSSIRLYRYTTSWNEIPTTIYSQDSSSIGYESSSPGLSSFIIAGKQEIIVAPQNPSDQNTQISGNAVLEQKTPAQEEPTQVNQQEDEESNGKFPTTLILIIIGVICSIIIADVIIVKRGRAKAANKEERIISLKKQYMYEGDQIIQNYNTQIQQLMRDPRNRQAIEALRHDSNSKMIDLHQKYTAMIADIKNEK